MEKWSSVGRDEDGWGRENDALHDLERVSFQNYQFGLHMDKSELTKVVLEIACDRWMTTKEIA